MEYLNISDTLSIRQKCTTNENWLKIIENYGNELGSNFGSMKKLIMRGKKQCYQEQQ